MLFLNIKWNGLEKCADFGFMKRRKERRKKWGVTKFNGSRAATADARISAGCYMYHADLLSKGWYKEKGKKKKVCISMPTARHKLVTRARQYNARPNCHRVKKKNSKIRSAPPFFNCIFPMYKVWINTQTRHCDDLNQKKKGRRRRELSSSIFIAALDLTGFV